MGWGVIDSDGTRQHHVASGVVLTEGEELAARLCTLHRELTAIIQRYQPMAAAIEQTFVNVNGAATLKLGQARGVAMLVPAQAGLPVAEYAPNAVKKAVVGVGHADKDQIAHMVRLQLPGAAPQGADAADALAIALCHALNHRGADRLARAVEASR